MIPKKKLYILLGIPLSVIAIALAVSILSSRICKGADVWRALVLALPDRISPSEMSITGYYIIKQTHEPVFRKDDGYSYSSKILKKWSRSIDYKSYTLCPDTALSFDAGHPFSVEVFKDHIGTVTAKFNPHSVVRRDGQCLKIDFVKPASRYLDFLSAYSVAPSVSISSKVETGLGAYIVKHIDGNEIVLRRKDKVRNGFNEIYVIDYKWKSWKEMGQDTISDYNFALSPKDLEKLGPGYMSFDNMSLKSYVLLINLPDQDMRRRLYNCVDIDLLRKAFFPEQSSFSFTKTILPVGIPGGHPGRPQQECRVDRGAAKKFGPVVFSNWREDNIPRLEAFAEDFFIKTGIRIKIVNYSAGELGRLFHRKPKPYGLVVIATAPDSDENYRMLASYYGKNNLLDFDIPEVERLYADLKKEDDAGRQKELAEMIAEQISQTHSLLPLFQTGRKVYYPKTIRNMVVGQELFEYPEIASFRR